MGLIFNRLIYTKYTSKCRLHKKALQKKGTTEKKAKIQTYYINQTCNLYQIDKNIYYKKIYNVFFVPDYLQEIITRVLARHMVWVHLKMHLIQAVFNTHVSKHSKVYLLLKKLPYLIIVMITITVIAISNIENVFLLNSSIK